MNLQNKWMNVTKLYINSHCLQGCQLILKKKKSGKKSKGILPPFLISKWFRIIREIIRFMLYIKKLINQTK